METDLLTIDPYEYLGLTPSCDKSELKEAYRRKVLQIHPDKCPGKDYEFIQLNACYRYIRQRLQQKQQYTRELSSQQPMTSAQMETIASKRWSPPAHTEAPRSSKVDFQTQLSDTCILGDAFDVNRALSEMQQYRPSSTRYEDVLKTVDSPEFVSKKYNKDLFNAAFERNKKNVSSTDLIAYEQLSAWNDCAGLPCASIVEDGEMMFVTNDTSAETLSAIKGYMMIEDKISDYDETSARTYSDDHQVTDQDLRSYQQTRRTACNVPKKSAIDFRESLKNMDYQMLDAQHDSRRQNAQRIRQMTTQLSPEMQAKLRDSKRILF